MLSRVRWILLRAAAMLNRQRYFRGRLRLTTMLLRAAQGVGPPLLVTMDGFVLQLDLDDGLSRALWLNRKLPQPEGRAVLEALCKPGDVVIDVGANLGYMALTAARAVGPLGHVIAIEPSRRSFGLLKANAQHNFPDRITALHAACDETDGTVTVYVSNHSEDYSSLRPDALPGRAHSEIVPARSLRSISRELGVAPAVVKVDVEGAEWQVLKGLLDEGSGPASLMVEVCAANTRQFGYAPSEMCQWLSDKGYRLTLVSQDGELEYSASLADGPGLYDVVGVR